MNKPVVCRRPGRMGNLAFTLVELLVVIGIIAVLISILMPVLAGARASAQDIACKSNLRQLGMSIHMFASEHGGRLPGVWTPGWGGAGSYSNDGLNIGKEAWQNDWLSYANPDGSTTEADYFAQAPQGGTLFTYTNKEPRLYRCPALEEGGVNYGGGSNGKFDYQAFALLSGSRLGRIPNECRPFMDQLWLKLENFPTPMLIEALPYGDAYQNAYSNYPGTNQPSGKTGNHQAYQGIALVHGTKANKGHGNLLALDGSVYQFTRLKAVDINGAGWQTRTGSSSWPWGQYTQLYYGLGFGKWP